MCEYLKALQKPFPAEDIEWRVGATNKDKTKGIALAYITNRAIQGRLDEIFGPFGWKNEYREWKGTSQICGISIKHENEWITKWDGADDSNTEATKGGLSDAMKRAGYQWGIGRYLYKLDTVWHPIKPAGRSYALVGEPKLPPWALPEGYEQKQPRTQTEHFEIDDSDIPPPPQEALDEVAQRRLKEEQDKAKRNRQNAVQGNRGGSGAARVYKLREELGWGWPDLSQFAGEVLNREVKFLKRDVTDESEWKQIEDAMMATKEGMAGAK